MLYLNPPFYVVNGVGCLPDHAGEQWYYQPLAPHLTLREDPASDRRRVPQFQLVLFRGQGSTGGLLNLDVNLGLDRRQQDEVARGLARAAGLDRPPPLAPIPLVDGTARLMLLGAATGSAPDGSSPSAFAVKIDHPANPSLFGDNNFSVSVGLDADAAALLERAVQGEIMPVGVAYRLEFLALRPAYTVRVEADWDRVQKHLETRFGYDGLFASVDIDKVVDELVESRVVLIEADTFVPEGEESGAVLDRRDQALDQVRDMVTDAFFEPSIDPQREAQDGWDRALHVATRVSALAVTGGWGSVGTFKLKHQDLTRIDRKRLDVNFRERTTVRQSIYPQGHLSGLLRLVEDEGVDLDQLVLRADLRNPFFSRRSVRVVSRADLQRDSIASVDVRLRYQGETRNVVLDAGTAERQVDWPSVVEPGGRLRREVEVGYSVNFQDVEATERPRRLTAPPRVTEADELEVFPRELYDVVPVPIMALDFPFGRYPAVEVRLRHLDPGNGIDQAETVLLTADQPERTFDLFVLGPGRPRFSYKVLYRAADHRDVEMPWVEADDAAIHLRDPFPSKRVVTVVPNVDWNQVKVVFADLSHTGGGGVVTEESFAFLETDDAPRTFTVHLDDPTRRQVEYRATIVGKDRAMIRVPPSVTLDRRIVIRPDTRGHRIIEVRPGPGDFAARRLTELRVELLYSDQAAGLQFTETLAFRSAGEQGFFEYDYVDEARDRYAYRTTHRYANGLSRISGWVQSDRPQLAPALD